MSQSQADLGLLLARADGAPVLPDGLPWQSALLAPAPQLQEQAQALDFLQTDDSLDSLVQGWGVLYPPGADALLEAIAPLIAWRGEGIAQAWQALRKPGSPPQVRTWEIGPDTTALHFLRRDLGALPRHQRPQYLLILGDPQGISLAFQQRLCRELFVGRLCGDGPDALAAYAAKVVATEKAEGAPTARLLLYSASDPGRTDPAVDTGLTAALKPLATRAADPARSVGGQPRDVCLMGPKGQADAQDWRQVRTRLAQPAPSVLFSLTHGAGDPRWEDEQKRLEQGRMVLPGGQRLDPADVAGAPFLPGGMWLYMACFGGGTPQQSAFSPWLRRLVGVGAARASGIPDVLATQAADGAFVARQPQLALANPDGPVAVIAHADIAFTYSFKTDVDGQGRYQADVTAIENLLDSLLDGRRAGLAFAKLDQALTSVDTGLLARAHREQEAADAALFALMEARDAAGQADRADEVGEVYACLDELILQLGREGLTLEGIAQALGWSLVRLAAVIGAAQEQERRRSMAANAVDWLAHHDLSGWILLGDPAARLAVAGGQAAAHDGGRSARIQAMWPEPSTGAAPEAAGEQAAGEQAAAVPAAGVQAAADVQPAALPVPIEVIELAIAEYIVDVLERGERTGKDVAEAHGLDFADLRRWHRAYTAGGRAALR